MPAEGRLDAGQELSLALSEGAEVFCASGRLRIEADVAIAVATGGGWRASQATRVRLVALEPSRYRVVPAPEEKKKPRDAGLVPVERVLAGLRRARRAA
jgi:hypothetical protein